MLLHPSSIWLAGSPDQARRVLRIHRNRPVRGAGYLVELAGERAVVPLSRSITCSAASRGKGPDRVPTQVVARLDGIITPSWVAAGTATLVSTRTRTRIASLGRAPSRGGPGPGTCSCLGTRRATSSLRSPQGHLPCRINCRAIRPAQSSFRCPSGVRSHVFAYASNTCCCLGGGPGGGLLVPAFGPCAE